MQLSDLFNKYGSDKDVNGYTHLYQILFEHKREDELNLLEIGIGTMIPGAASSMVGYSLECYKPGGSLRAWRDYFTNGNVTGVDVQPDTQFEEERISTYLCDSTNKELTSELCQRLEPQDIIVDDGLHSAIAQLKTLENFFPLLKEGGIYIIEDICNPQGVNSTEVKLRVGKSPFFYVGTKNQLCVIQKVDSNSITIKY